MCLLHIFPYFGKWWTIPKSVTTFSEYPLKKYECVLWKKNLSQFICYHLEHYHLPTNAALDTLNPNWMTLTVRKNGEAKYIEHYDIGKVCPYLLYLKI